MPSAKSNNGAIKGYLPVRLSLPSLHGTDVDDTFFFVKEHHAASSEKSESTSTLFVANAPFLPGVSTKVLLKSLFGQYGDVLRATVVENPRAMSLEASSFTPSWTDQAKYPSFYYGTVSLEGKFAQVVFESSKDMKKSLRSLRNIMTDKKSTKEGNLPGIKLSKMRIQTLINETKRLQRDGADMDAMEANEDSGEDDDNDSVEDTPTGILALAERYRSSYRVLSRSALLEECNKVMESFENAEEDDRQARETAKEGPDEDGFTTVTYASQSVGSKREMEQHVGGANRRKANKRSRKKKDTTGKSELQDFYRFQMKESRKKNLQDLRKRFEDDLAKVKKLKEERQYRPF